MSLENAFTEESPLATHQVENQPPILENYNLYEGDLVLQKAVAQEGGSIEENKLKELGGYLGHSETLNNARLANVNKPIFHSHDRRGHRIDYVEFHPAYHELLRQTFKYGIHCSPWVNPVPGSHVARAAMLYLSYQVESGHICPTTMTYGCVPSMKTQKEVWDPWQDKVLSYEYDPSFQPVENKKGAIIGMAMTEKQGGSDIRTNTTTAQPLSGRGPGKEYLITGHKWFCSHPMGDGFLMLAQTKRGPSCFFVPRWCPDGSKNSIFIQRLKDKLGDHSNASSEIELKNTWGRMVGEEGRGIPIIIEMANYTRLDCAVAGASLMRQALTQALHYTSHRSAFGAILSQQPMMERLLGDLILESEAATRFAMRIARAYDKQTDEFESAFKRIATTIAKYWLTKRSVTFVYECMEAHGGNGYVEESVLPRVYRQAPLNSIWEGSGNIMCLDVLRAMQKEPKSLESLRQELSSGLGKNPQLDQLIDDIESNLKSPENLMSNARKLVEQLALALQASLLIKSGDDEKAEAFCQNRLNVGPKTFGTLKGNYNFQNWIQGSKVAF
jgi:putative acyl-CoA dehydrogenase